MKYESIITAFVAGFIFSFLIELLWHEMVRLWGPLGGWIGAGFIVGTVWIVNHGLNLIPQMGPWVDMTWGLCAGLFTASMLRGGKFKKAVPHLVGGILGGIVAGYILSLFV
ncbi:MAG: hypothetical protein PWQ34_64 [Caldanaerobacter sp.]|jgi:hypothetical protein|uniref:Lin0368 family putative glycerol transporter subunit n=1 Tax=Caldanaerobacter TaxID=249529 RepID=UPI000749C6FF|nr:hypothetical protein [Caldanaerobacter sp.]KUK14324.1 MAG: Uncharacterized protein XD52_0390 [bacterium 42_11]MDI3501662.1 hypothetical protein [Thermoanaerobacter sp.]MDI3517917.1 hypothetical protein [Caldanaerobacter sp.]MDK2793580.1 hypothetical protein [Caldanaerobacter sp.]